MDVLSVRALHGPNRWSHWPVAEVLVDCRSGNDGFAVHGSIGRLRQWLPAEARFQLSSPEEGPAELLAQVIQGLQQAAGVPIEFGAVRSTDRPGVALLAIQFEELTLFRACLDVALRMLSRAGHELDIQSEIRKLVDLADNVRLGPSSRAIVSAAVARGIPYRRLNEGSLVQLGEGKHQRRIWTAETDATSALAECIASDKDLTKQLLRAVGVPVPRGRPVESPEDAWEAAEEIGLPVAVKPRKANHARGISLDLTTKEEVLAAYEFAMVDGDYTGVMVEQFAPGQAHRLLVVGDLMVAAARGESEYVTGDGRRTIRELVDEVNQDPRRGENYTDLLNVLKLDAAALIELKKQGYTPDSIPPAGQQVLIQPVGDLTTDVTDQVHPQNAAHAVLAAKAVGLDIAGIDLVAEDISRPLEEQRGMILEVNAGPSLSMHIAPLYGKPQPVGEAIVDMLFPPGHNGRVPIVAVTGSGDRRAMVEQIERIWQEAGVCVGTATTAGTRVGGRPVAVHAARDAQRVQALLTNPQVEAVVFESQPAEAADEGLGCSRCDLVIVVSGEGHEEESAATTDGVIAAVRAVPPGGRVLANRSSRLYGRLQEASRGEVLEIDTVELRQVIGQLLAAPFAASRA